MILNKEVLIEESSNVMDFICNKIEDADTLNLEELDFEKTLVVIIDMNNGFAKKGALYSKRVEKLIKPIEEFVKYMIRKKAEVIAFSDCHTEESPELLNYPQHCMSETLESELVDELKNLNIKLIRKNSTNAYLEEAFNLDSNIENIIVIGDCTDICIYQFAITTKAKFNLSNEKKRVIVPIEYVDTFHAPFHHGDFMNAVFLSSMMDNGIEVVKVTSLGV